METQDSILGLRENLSTWCLYGLLMAGLTFGAFGNLSTHLFDGEDTQYLRDAAVSQRDFSFVTSPDRIYPGRPTFNLYLWVAYKLFEDDPAGYHNLQVCLHLAVSLLLAFTFRRLGSNFELSLIGGLLFLLNVAHFRAVHWISCTNYLLALFLGLTALLLYSHGLRTRNSRWSYAAAAVLAVAIFAHASTVAITLPLLILTLTAKLPKLKVIHLLIPQFAIAGICGILLIFVYPKAPQLVMASRASQPVDLVLNLFWFWGRLITTAHWLPEFLDLAETTVWECTAGFFFFGLSAFLSVRHGLSVLWTVWLIACFRRLPLVSIGGSRELKNP